MKRFEVWTPETTHEGDTYHGDDFTLEDVVFCWVHPVDDPDGVALLSSELEGLEIGEQHHELPVMRVS